MHRLSPVKGYSYRVAVVSVRYTWFLHFILNRNSFQRCIWQCNTLPNWPAVVVVSFGSVWNSLRWISVGWRTSVLVYFWLRFLLCTNHPYNSQSWLCTLVFLLSLVLHGRSYRTLGCGKTEHMLTFLEHFGDSWSSQWLLLNIIPNSGRYSKAKN